jgi:hypothetical protein
MWLYRNEVFTESQIGSYVGFVYKITNVSQTRHYIGKKLFWFSRTKLVKGKKKKVKVPSDWPTYWSSSSELQLDVVKLGESNFIREILHLCYTKGTMSYLELREQMDARVLENQNEWYNGFIGCRIHRSHVKL